MSGQATDALIGYGERVSQLAACQPNQIAVYIDDGRQTLAVTLQQLDERANALARYYQSLGITLNQIVTIALPNSLELMVSMLAAWKVGAVPNPISSSLPAAEGQSIVHCADSALIVGGDSEQFIDRKVLPADQVWVTGFDCSPLPPLAEHGGERALASGGSTGIPKLILPRDQAVFNPDLAVGLFKPEKTALVAGPMYHAVPFSSAWQAIFNGCTAVVMKSFDAERCLYLIQKYAIDRSWFVPTMMLRIWKLGAEVREKYDVSCLQHVLSGGAPLPPWLMQCWIDWLGPEKLNDVFGPSERIGGAMINGVEWLQHPGSVGRPLAYAQLKIFDEDDRECPPGVMGEIFTLPQSGRGSTYEYRSAVNAVKPENRRIGEWESVGDMGYLDEEGFLYLGDRKSDMILSRGRNIYPAEIEGAIQEFTAVRSCAVIGLPEEDGANCIHAIVDSAGEQVDQQALEDFLGLRIAPYKMPKTFEFVNQLLRNDAGKVRRSALRAERLSQRI